MKRARRKSIWYNTHITVLMHGGGMCNSLCEFGAVVVVVGGAVSSSSSLQFFFQLYACHTNSFTAECVCVCA